MPSEVKCGLTYFYILKLHVSGRYSTPRAIPILHKTQPILIAASLTSAAYRQTLASL